MTPSRLSTFFAGRGAQLAAIRHDLHARPELSREETETANYILQHLRALGLDPVACVGGHGIVAAIAGRSPGRAVALRAEMDALPILEEGALAYKSRHPGKMHACGHDGHMAMLLGAASYLASAREFPGTVYILFQAAEERFSGARAMLEDGLLQRFPFDGIFGLHNWPGMKAGHVAVHNGPVMAGTNEFEITFRADGGHGAMPHLTGDPIVAGGYLLSAIQQIVSRSINPLEAAVITIGSFQAGAAPNIIPDKAVLTGTYRAFSPTLLAHLRKQLEAATQHAATISRTTASVTFDGPDFPAVVNSLAEAELVRDAVRELFGAERLTTLPPAMAGDDFGVFAAHKPAAYVWLGNGDESAGLHQPDYDFNDAILADGASLLAHIAETYLLNNGIQVEIQ
ncbi:hippurate hydrolase [Rhizobium sp. BK650]|uniref:M20 metallopeptidase family protein n=1 Tax=Rhizobium sp. BK650 TaxID=2586990 RepID=UPI00161E669C|nr:amidohydrolase [Rhizobium sp. BK650]MBB3660050.1 hippurate hydrolase [Rhizobium sp. BK650]